MTRDGRCRWGSRGRNGKEDGDEGEKQRANEEQPLYKNRRPELDRAEPQPASDPRPGKAAKAAIKQRVLLALFHRAMPTGGPANQSASGVGAGQRFIRFFEVTVWPLSPCGGTPRPAASGKSSCPLTASASGRQAWTHVLIRHSTASPLVALRAVLAGVFDRIRGAGSLQQDTRAYTLHGAEGQSSSPCIRPPSYHRAKSNAIPLLSSLT